ncbi:MAG: phospholipase D-like domain-containing protein [Patescibacteria group bacterium]|jgi:phosphatidylserine/phosphatidylglycerophosphate/cardiolipin synthase-like enzyme|nr:phospholipase D-like domain-containing protein [Patescibacteria group bacterium]
MIKDIKSQLKVLLKYKKHKKRKDQLKTVAIAIIIFLFILLTISLIFSKQVFKAPTYQAQQNNSADTLQAQIFFNNNELDQTFEKIIAEALDEAQDSIDIAMYSFNIFALKRDLYRAHERGVNVNIILSQNKYKQHQMIFDDLPQSIAITHVGSQDDDYLSQYMHHKFIIVDKGTKNQKLITGSVNLTEYQILFDPSYLFITSDPYIIQTYTEEFNRLSQGYSGPDKLALNNYQPWAQHIDYQDSFLDIYFSPGFKENNINTKIAKLIAQAKEDIKIMAWQASDQNIAREIIKQAKQGLSISIIADDTNFADRYSIFPYLLRVKQEYQLDNLEIITDTWKSLDLYEEIPNELVGNDFFNSFFHHHALIIDHHLVLFGTNNWSNMGSKINDENIMISNNEYLVNNFEKVFALHYTKLRNTSVNISLDDKEIELDADIFTKYQGHKMSIFAFDNFITQESDICYETLTITDSKLKTKCENKIYDIYIHNQNGLIQAGNIVYKN